MPTPDKFARVSYYMLAGKMLDSDWNDTIATALHHCQLLALATTHHAGKFYLHTEAPLSWCATKLDLKSTSFVAWAHEHMLAMICQAHLYFPPNIQLPDTCCPLCSGPVEDDAMHWFSCLALQPAWQKHLNEAHC